MAHSVRLAICCAALAVPAAASASPSFRHIIVVVQENRTPDNLFGSNPTFEPGVDLATSGVNSKGETIPLGPVALANCYDISHAHSAFEAMYTKGADQEAVSPKTGCTVPANPQFNTLRTPGPASARRSRISILRRITVSPIACSRRTRGRAFRRTSSCSAAPPHRARKARTSPPKTCVTQARGPAAPRRRRSAWR